MPVRCSTVLWIASTASASTLYQLHAVGDRKALDACFARGGPMDAILQAPDGGLVGHIGITGHGSEAPATHAEALRRFDFSTVMVASNLYLYGLTEFRRDYEELLSLCQANDVGVHILKATAKASWDGRAPTHNTWYEPFTAQEDIDRSVAWVLNQPVATLCSAGDVTVFPRIVDAAERYRDIDERTQLTLLTDAVDYGNIFEPVTA